MDFLSRRRSNDSREKRRRGRHQHGTASVEMIAVLPLLLLLLFATIDFGFLFRDWLHLGHSARVAARTATMYHRPCITGVVQGLAVTDGMDALTQGGVNGGNIAITGLLCTRQRVTARATAPFQSPVLGLSFQLAASAQMRGEY